MSLQKRESRGAAARARFHLGGDRGAILAATLLGLGDRGGAILAATLQRHEDRGGAILAATLLVAVGQGEVHHVAFHLGKSGDILGKVIPIVVA